LAAFLIGSFADSGCNISLEEKVKMPKHKFKVSFGKPSKPEVLLLVVCVFLLFWLDILQNKVLDFGVLVRKRVVKKVVRYEW